MLSSKLTSPSVLRGSQSSITSKSQRSWIEQTFEKRECVRFVGNTKDKNSKCGCGRPLSRHFTHVTSPSPTGALPGDKWNTIHHTEASPTDAFGTIEFQGGSHPTKAQYVRISCDTKPELILQLLQKQWCLSVPKLLISVHGGIANFDLQPKLKRVFRKGLLKAAKTTGAWIVTGGTNTGVMRHVGDALGDTLVQARNNIVTIGIAPWGVVNHRHDLIGKETVTPYHAVGCPTAHSVVLNSNHSYFLLVDNGTVGKYGGEIQLRKKLEKYISQQKITTRFSNLGSRSYNGTPVVCLILEGGANTIRTVLECITDTPPVPVVVCDGSGRAADLLAFTHRYAQDDGTMPENLRDQLILTIKKTFQYSHEQAEKHFIELMLCVKKKELITVFRMSEGAQDIDLAILTALLKGQNASAPDQLSLALTWNREDIARNHIFVYGQEWPEGALDQAMMDALVHDRVDFVKLLLENGVSMHKWLTFTRLEELYNKFQDNSSTLHYLLKEVKKNAPSGYKYTLLDIGLVLEKLMGGAYRASYCRKKFKTMYNGIMKKGHQISSIITEIPLPAVRNVTFPEIFKYPFSELMVWAVLLKRQKMAKFMWQHGEEALAKALIACKLYKSMAHEAAQDELDIDISDELKRHSMEFASLALELLEHCYDTDDDLTQQLLTYELENWSDQTALSLAVAASHRDFIANTCCQMLLTEMWMGGLRMRKYTSLKVLLGIMMPPSIMFLEFKSKEELLLMPQTMEEHIQELEDSDSESDSESDTDEDWNQARRKSIHQPSGGPKQQQNDMVRAKVPNPTPNGSLLTAPLEMSFGFPRKNSPLGLGKKFYEFYTAPIVKFWAHTVGYIAFICLYTYMVLVRMDFLPTWQEVYVITYIITFGMDKVREIMMSEPQKFHQKIVVYLSELWNACDIASLIVFLIALILRFLPETMPHGRVMFCIGLIYWYVRILDIFAVNKYLGPYVMMIGKMVKDMAYFIVILLVVLMSFGVTRQSIRYPMSEPSWTLAKNIFLKPYFMIYGEVYAAEIDPVCGTNETLADYDPEVNPPCVAGLWVVPAVMSIYLIVANILLINLLIAVFNNTFHMVNSISTQVWKFQRYSLVLEFESKPILPPPLILVCHLYLMIKYIIRRCQRKTQIYDTGLKLFLDAEVVELIHDFEEECVEQYFRDKEQRRWNSTDERIRHTNELVENMALRMDDINQKVNAVKLSLQTVDYRLGKQDEIALQTAETLAHIQQLTTLQQLQTQLQLQALAQRQPSSSGDSGQQSDSQSIISQTIAAQYGALLGEPPSFSGLSPCSLGSTGSNSSIGSGILSVDTIAANTVPMSAPVGAMDSPPTFDHRVPPTKDRLRPFTDYGKRPPRGSYKRAMTIATPVGTPFVKNPQLVAPSANNSQNLESSDPVVLPSRGHKKTRSLKGKKNSDRSISPNLASQLYNRRKNRAVTRIQSSNNGNKPTPITEETSPQLLAHNHPPSHAARVRFSIGDSPRSNTMPEESDNNIEGMAMSPRANSLPHSPLTADTNTPFFNKSNSDGPVVKAAVSSRFPTVGRASSQPISVPHDRNSLQFLRGAMHTRTLTEGHEPYTQPIQPQSNAATRPSQLPSMPTPLSVTPIVTPSRTDYTSITDDIDTSGVKYGGSPGSPATPRHIYFGLDVNVDLYTKKDSANSNHRGRPTRGDYLKHAEEAEHEQMELTIRKRIRQISLTESDSLCNIARQAIDTLETSEEDSGDDAYNGYFSDEQEWLSQSAAASDLHLLSKVNSEPTLDKLGHTMDTYMSTELRNLKSQQSVSPPKVSIDKGFDWPLTESDENTTC